MGWPSKKDASWTFNERMVSRKNGVYVGLPPCPGSPKKDYSISVRGSQTKPCHWHPGREHNPKYVHQPSFLSGRLNRLSAFNRSSSCSEWKPKAKFLPATNWTFETAKLLPLVVLSCALRKGIGLSVAWWPPSKNPPNLLVVPWTQTISLLSKTHATKSLTPKAIWKETGGTTFSSNWSTNG